MHLHSPTSKHPTDLRAFAACSVLGDPNLPERFCCWSCRKQSAEGEIKSLRPSMDFFTQHWHVSHASALQTEWTTLALWGSISIEDLAWEIVGVDLEESPIPRAAAALPTIPRVMPERRGGHNPRTYGSPWFVHCPAVPYKRALPPSYPPPSYLLPSLNAPQEDFTHSSSTSQLGLLAVNKSSKTSTSSSSHALSSPVIERQHPMQGRRSLYLFLLFLLLLLLPQLQKDAKPNPGFILIGWQNPIMLWSSHLLTFFHADFGKEFPSRTFWSGPSRSCPSPSSALFPLLYRTEHFSRRGEGRKGAEKMGGRGVASKGGKKEKRTRENWSVYRLRFATFPFLLCPFVSTVVQGKPGTIPPPYAPGC